MQIQTPRQFYYDLYMKVPSDVLLQFLNINFIPVSKDEINYAAMQPGDKEQHVRRYFLGKLLSVPMREVPIRFSWPYQAQGLNRLQFIPNVTDDTLAVHPRIDYDRWIVDCPYCPGAEMATDKFFCISCLNRGIYVGGPPEYIGDITPVGNRWIRVEWPEKSERMQQEEDYVGGVE